VAIDIRLKHSSVQDRAPLAADLVAGELAVNIHENSAAIYFLDSAGNVRKMAGPATTNAPAAPVDGDTWVDTATNPATINIWDPTAGGGAGAWVPIAGGTVTGPGLTGIWERVGTVISPVTDGDSLQLNDGTGTTKIDLNADGTATFASHASFGGTDNGPVLGGGIVNLTVNGSANADTSRSGALVMQSQDKSAIYAVFSTSSGLNIGGFDTTKRGINLYDGNSVAATLDTAGDFLLGGTLPGTPNISLNANGSAEFAGLVYSGAVNHSATASGAFLSYGGQVQVNSVEADASTSRVFIGKDKNVTTSEIYADGSATFDGNVGIGTTSPSKTLEMRLANDSDEGIRLNEVGNTYHDILASSGSLYIHADSKGDDGSGNVLKFGVGSAGERMRITDSGRIYTYSSTVGLSIAVSAAASTTNA